MLLDSEQFSHQLFESLAESRKSLTVFSAFTKLKALEHKSVGPHLAGKNVTLVARWQKRDLVSGASDLGVYELCKLNGWRFGVNLNLHGKLFLIDSSDIFLGSANLTQRGLHLGLVGNHEFGTKIEAENADLHKITQFIDAEVTWMTDELFEKICNEVKTAQDCATPINDVYWSHEIFNHCTNPVQYLWVDELLLSTPNNLLRPSLDNFDHLHDLELLGLSIDNISALSLAEAFKRQRIYSWLRSTLENNSMSFGALSARLHNSLLDDPKPYRVSVKTYIKNLFAWAKHLEDEFTIERPNHSQILSLKS
ncbi:hypothetical protein [Alteromonas mediterranea]|uniref:hypothetical protein n=1 Tax=Alteromonas mediterranea TaxID=314275 RepID=UPI0032B1953C